MDREQFDALARLAWTRQSRRAALATLLGAALLDHDPGAALAKTSKPKRKTTTTVAAADACYPGTRCTPGKGRNTSRCDFAHSTAFRSKDVRGANLSDSNFFAADLTGADFRGANLSGSCFVSADLSGARLGASVNLRNAVFCNTTMPDGSVDDSGCEGETPCCHLRVQSCPDGTVGCYTRQIGGCGDLVFRFASVGRCYHFPVCCPCDHPGQDYWDNQCNLSEPRCDGRCIAQDEAPLFCWGC